MKTIIFALALALTSSVLALDVNKINAGRFYVSSYSNATMFSPIKAGETVFISAFGNTGLYCGVSTISNMTNIINESSIDERGIYYTARTTDLHAILCIKDGGPSGNNFLLVSDPVPVKRSTSEATYEVNPELSDELQYQMSLINE